MVICGLDCVFKFCDFLLLLEDKFVWIVYCINISDIFKLKVV